MREWTGEEVGLLLQCLGDVGEPSIVIIISIKLSRVLLLVHGTVARRSKGGLRRRGLLRHSVPTEHVKVLRICKYRQVSKDVHRGRIKS